MYCAQIRIAQEYYATILSFEMREGRGRMFLDLILGRDVADANGRRSVTMAVDSGSDSAEASVTGLLAACGLKAEEMADAMENMALVGKRIGVRHRPVAAVLTKVEFFN